MNDSRAIESSPRRVWRAAAAAILAVECAALAAAGAVYIAYAVTGDSANLAFPLAVAALAVVLAVAVGAATWGMWHGRRWAASLSITWQVMQAAAGLSVFFGRPALGAAIIGLSIVCLVATMRAAPRAS